MYIFEDSPKKFVDIGYAGEQCHLCRYYML